MLPLAVPLRTESAAVSALLTWFIKKEKQPVSNAVSRLPGSWYTVSVSQALCVAAEALGRAKVPVQGSGQPHHKHKWWPCSYLKVHCCRGPQQSQQQRQAPVPGQQEAVPAAGGPAAGWAADQGGGARCGEGQANYLQDIPVRMGPLLSGAHLDVQHSTGGARLASENSLD